MIDSESERRLLDQFCRLPATDARLLAVHCMLPADLRSTRYPHSTVSGSIINCSVHIATLVEMIVVVARLFRYQPLAIKKGQTS